MRAVFIGAGELTVMTARQLLGRGYEVIIIEADKSRIEDLTADLEAGFIHGDGSKPAILREASPSTTDFLFCLTGNDQNNIIASLVGRSLGFRHVVTRIEDPSYEHICIELGLEDVVVPDLTISRYLADMCSGLNPLEVSAVIKGDARIFSFVAREQDEGTLADLAMPEGSRIIILYRNEELILPDGSTKLQKGDEAVVLCRSKVLPDLQERWSPAAEEVTI
jgi:trk system potassium uptake protein TrkA